MGAAEAVHEEHDLVPCAQREVVSEDEVQDLRREFVRRAHRDQSHTLLAVDAHAETDDVVREVKGWLASGGDAARLGGHTHRAGVVTGLLRDAGEFVQGINQGGCGSGNLHDGHESRDTAAVALVRRRSRAHVIGDDDRLHFNAFLSGEFSADVEVHDVTGVVAVKIEHPFAPAHRLGSFENDVRRRSREDVTTSGAVRHALAYQAVVDRLMARATAYEEGRCIRTEVVHDDGALAHLARLAVVGEHESVEQVVRTVQGVVDDLLGWVAHGLGNGAGLKYALVLAKRAAVVKTKSLDHPVIAAIHGDLRTGDLREQR